MWQRGVKTNAQAAIAGKIKGKNGGGVRNVRVNDQIPFNKGGYKNL
jgi:hypothetical protein